MMAVHPAVVIMVITVYGVMNAGSLLQTPAVIEFGQSLPLTPAVLDNSRMPCSKEEIHETCRHKKVLPVTIGMKL